ncbi:hypothetical protein GCM10011391_24490 [Pullulanibacillus camelliae]|uniref:Uncharacterized protein n=1 Tax=Pullulanibacillus camelliae TaxID=1707096 RepID=A0A8J2YID9_9BACL|nr:hypothetical protein GCM10011391_24490 [Pullulanibacillus camelliae]
MSELQEEIGQIKRSVSVGSVRTYKGVSIFILFLLNFSIYRSCGNEGCKVWWIIFGFRRADSKSVAYRNG